MTIGLQRGRMLDHDHARFVGDVLPPLDDVIQAAKMFANEQHRMAPGAGYPKPEPIPERISEDAPQRKNTDGHVKIDLKNEKKR